MASATADPLLHRILANVHHHPIISRWHASTGYLNLQRVRPVAVYLQDDLDAEDACGATAANAQDRWLAEAGMVLRDPPAMHMLAAEVVEILYRCAAFKTTVCLWLSCIQTKGAAAVCRCVVLPLSLSGHD